MSRREGYSAGGEECDPLVPLAPQVEGPRAVPRGRPMARGLPGGTYGPANRGRSLSPEEIAAVAAETGEQVAKPKRKKFASPKRAKAARERAKKKSANMWNRYG